MKTVISFLFVFLSISYAVSENHYVNQWAVEIQGGHEEAKRVAKEHGYDIVKEVCFVSFYLFFGGIFLTQNNHAVRFL